MAIEMCLHIFIVSFFCAFFLHAIKCLVNVEQQHHVVVDNVWHGKVHQLNKATKKCRYKRGDHMTRSSCRCRIGECLSKNEGNNFERGIFVVWISFSRFQSILQPGLSTIVFLRST